MTVTKRQNEEEFFAKTDIEKKRLLADEIQSQYRREEQQKLKDIHFMHCSKCGMELQSLVFKGVIMEKCYSCGAVVLDEAELDKLAGTEGSLISSIVGLFK